MTNKYLIIDVNENISKAILYLEKSSLKTLFVVDKKKKFIGSITDGDIRRGLLDNIKLEIKIKKIVNKGAKVFYDDTYNDDLRKFKNEDSIDLIPILCRKTKKILNVKKIINNEFLINSDTPVFIMAGGLGRRLMPLTKKAPKPMLLVKGKPILEHIIRNLQKQGFGKFIISINYLGNLIKRYFKNGSAFNTNISYIEEKSFLGTGGSLSLLNIKEIKSKEILLINGDILTSFDFSNLIKFHRKNKSFATVVCRSKEFHYPFGVILNRGRKLIGFREKPVYKNLINTGIYCLDIDAIKLMKKNHRIDMPELLLHFKSKRKNVLVYPIVEDWNDIGTIEVFDSYNDNKKNIF